MGKCIAILYFSGTGNTAVVAGLLKDGLVRSSQVEMIKIEDILQKKVEFTPAVYDLIGVGYPSYGFNVPGIVYDFVNQLGKDEKKDVFLFMTCAGPCYINDIASTGLKRKLKKLGYNVIYEKVFVMPANVIIQYREEIVKQLYNAAVKKTLAMAGDLSCGKVSVRNAGILPMLLRWTYVWIERPWIKTIALDFTVNESCIRCRKCVDNCPGRNISLRDNKIKFGINCAGCYRCVYNCPQRAISARIFKKAILKKGYDISKVIRDDNIEGNFITKDTKGIFKSLYKYLSE